MKLLKSGLKLLLILPMLICLSCAEDREPMDEAEKIISSRYHSEYVSISMVQESTIVNGVRKKDESYFKVEIFESVDLNKGRKNPRFLRDKCKEITQYLLDSTGLTSLAPYKVIRFEVIEDMGLRNETSTMRIPILSQTQ